MLKKSAKVHHGNFASASSHDTSEYQPSLSQKGARRQEQVGDRAIEGNRCLVEPQVALHARLGKISEPWGESINGQRRH
jgi:hypothetical protein